MASAPAHVVAHWLISRGLVSAPSPSAAPTAATVFVGMLPDDRDFAVAVFDTVGRIYGRFQRGEYALTPGIRLLLRDRLYDAGYTRMQRIVEALRDFHDVEIIVRGEPFKVKTFIRSSTILALGEEVGTKRQLFAVNGRIAFQDEQPTLG